MQKILFCVLLAVIALFQYELWYGHGGIYDSQHLNNIISLQLESNQSLQNRNDAVVVRLQELKGSPILLEARARRELNLIKPNETLLVIPEANLKGKSP